MAVEAVGPVHVVSSDFSEDMVKDFKDTVTEVLAKGAKAHKDIASRVKASFDTKHPPTDNKATSGVFHCIVGTNFACSVTHETRFACLVKVGNVSILIFKSKDSPFD